MNREITELTAIIFANLLDVIPLISNTDDRIDLNLLNIYYRTAAYFQDMSQELLIEHVEENNILEYYDQAWDHIIWFILNNLHVKLENQSNEPLIFLKSAVNN